MSMIFLPSCKVKTQFAYASDALRKYLEGRYDVHTLGCCKQSYTEASSEDTAVFVCNHCAAVMEESSQVRNVISAWNIIDDDPDFVFPDYHGERMTVQDCWRACEKRDMQDAVRSILRKMNIEPVELSLNHENVKYCGTATMKPFKDIERKYAPERYKTDCTDAAHQLPDGMEEEWLGNYCRQIETERTVCYCRACLNGIKRGGKKSVHLLELIFPEP